MKNNIVKFSVMIYLVFFVLFICTGMVNTFVTKNPIVMQIMTTICSWTSFYVLMFIFPKLLPGKTRREFFKELFVPRIDWILLVEIFVVQMLLFFLCVFVVSQYKNTTILSLLTFSPKVLAVGFVVQLIGGPLGEEPAYRGFALPAMTKFHGVIKAGFINGVVWGMWHFPLWMISGYKGIHLLIYCVGFLIPIVSASICMSIIASKNINIIYPILIHQMVNFSLDVLYTDDLLEFFVPMSVLYVIVAVVLSIDFMKGEVIVGLSFDCA